VMISLTDEARGRLLRLSELAREAGERADEMGERVRAWSRVRTIEGNRRAGAYTLRWAVLLRRATDLAELHADLSGAIREGV
jgi:hypothetical protein